MTATLLTHLISCLAHQFAAKHSSDINRLTRMLSIGNIGNVKLDIFPLNQKPILLLCNLYIGMMNENLTSNFKIVPANALNNGQKSEPRLHIKPLYTSRKFLITRCCHLILIATYNIISETALSMFAEYI